MFHADITFTLALIALVSGAFLVLSARTQKDTMSCKIIGHAVAIIAIVILLFSGYCVIKRAVNVHHMQRYWKIGRHMSPMQRKINAKRMYMHPRTIQPKHMPKLRKMMPQTQK